MGFFVNILLVLVATSDNLVFGGLETLGDDIAASVQASLAPLQNLGSRISEQVQHNLQPVRDLEGLGGRITQQVEKELEPVRALELKFKMQRGEGGVTIATSQPEGKQFIIKNSRTYTCDGTIDLTSGECSGTLEPFKISASSPQPDWCYIRNFALVNNNLCLSTGPISVTITNGFMECSGNSPILRLTHDEYKNLCNSHSQKVEYRYIPDLNDAKHVDIPNENKYVECDNEDANIANVCVFTVENVLPLPSTGNSQIFVNY